MPSNKQFLGFGIISYADRAPGFSLTSKQIQEMVDQEVKKLEAAGVDLTMFEVNPDDPELVPAIKTALKSQEWDGILIGWGVRGQMNLTDVFEAAVNLAVQETNGAVKLMFPVSPDRVLESVYRAFPDMK